MVLLTAAMLTEERNPRTLNIDLLETLDILRLINDEDQKVALAVREALPQIARAVEGIVERLRQGGRLFYVGAGTSGRLGVLDAVECPPTYGVSPDVVQGILAGGYEACYKAVEVSEDDAIRGERDLDERGVSARDAVTGVAASATTPYTIGAVRRAREIGALTLGLSCNRQADLSKEVDIAIEIAVGPEVIAGSTRMKAGTAQKMVLNMISTATMVRLGHVYSNLMVNVQPKNQKLVRRAVRIISEAAEVSPERAQAALEETGNVKSAIVMLKLGCTPAEADTLLAQTGSIRKALEGK